MLFNVYQTYQLQTPLLEINEVLASTYDGVNFVVKSAALLSLWQHGKLAELLGTSSINNKICLT